MWDLARSVVSFTRVVLVLGVVAVACSGRSKDTSPESCATDADCEGGQRCSVDVDRPVVGMWPCAQTTACSEEDALCPSDQVCAPFWQALDYYPYCGERLCARPCTADSCPADATCGTEGVCALTQCDAAGAEPCPELWRCDPAAAPSASRDALTGTTVTDAPLEADRYFARGCVRKACDEPGGYECAAAWSCKPDVNTHPVGCVPDECQDTGHCSEDTYLVCRTDAKHADRGPLDVNGCVPRTCDDGYSCARVTEAGVDVGRCQYGAPNADYYGCVVLPCTNDDECFYGYRCDRSSPQADERGCRMPSCTEGVVCPEGFVCDPTAAVHDGADCALLPVPGTGMGGSGGNAAGGTGGSSGGGLPRVGGAGGSDSGGTTGRESPAGRCVAR